jgi:ADP-heptose:LPS heptosyltransferase
VATLIPGVRRVIAADPFWDRAPGRGKGKIGPFVGALRHVARSRYDVAVLAAAPWRTAAAVAATRIPVRIGLRRRKSRVFLTHALPDEDSQQPVMAELARLLEPLGIGHRELRYRLDAAPLADRRDRIKAQLAGRFVALHPFASKRDRCVALSVWTDLSARLARRGLATLWIGSSAELAEIRQLPAEPSWSFGDRACDGSLADTAAALSLASLFVGHDSGPLHVAGGFGVPVVGVFAPGEPRRTFPQGVGPARLLARPTPDSITTEDILREALALTGDGQ